MFDNTLHMFFFFFLDEPCQCKVTKKNTRSTSTTCTCVQNKLQCTSKCNCKDCDNYKPTAQRSFEVVSCRCGAARPEDCKSCLKQSCCPCSKSGAGCLVSCSCRNCHNEMGVRPVLEKQQTPHVKRKDITYKRKRGSEFFTDETEPNKTEDVWSGQETAALLCCVNILLLTAILFFELLRLFTFLPSTVFPMPSYV